MAIRCKARQPTQHLEEYILENTRGLFTGEDQGLTNENFDLCSIPAVGHTHRPGGNG